MNVFNFKGSFLLSMGFLCMFGSSFSEDSFSNDENKKNKRGSVNWTNFEEINFEDFKPTIDKIQENESGWRNDESELAPWKPYIGVGICLLSSILCGSSYPIKRYAITYCNVSKTSKYKGRFVYITNKIWLLGQVFIIIGELLHYFAFLFVQAIIVCTVQILTVLVTAFVSSKLLDEKTNQYSRVGIALAVSGCWIITFNAPPEEPIYSSKKMISMIMDPGFTTFFIACIVITLLNMIYAIPKYSDKSSFFYTFETALLGSIIMVSIKGLSLILTEGFQHWFPWLCLTVLIICTALQIDYTNSALEKYNTLMITVQFYMSYSAFTIIASMLLFKLWQRATLESVMSSIIGLVNIVLGVLLYTIFEVHDHGLAYSVSSEI